MTIKVYRVSRDGERRPVGVPVEVVAEPEKGTKLPDSLTYPPCTCDRCRAAGVCHD
ncbi:hypothetical protein [Streptomyces sp. NPDC020965]|uniref:hypothetical protein n=1 Tax=Streptomyces sp. NPDC020965 TaxID=3365105 RepID=UPI00379DBA7C